VQGSGIGAIRAVYYGAPFLLVLGQIACIAFYNLDKLHPQIVADLNARSRMAGEKSLPAAAPAGEM